MPEHWVSGAALALWETHLSCKSRRWKMEKSPFSTSEKPFNPSPDLGKGAFLQGHGHGESSILVSLPPPGPGLPLATTAEPGPPACCRPPAWSSLSPSLAALAPLARFWGWQPAGRLVTVTHPQPQRALFAKGLMFSC